MSILKMKKARQPLVAVNMGQTLGAEEEDTTEARRRRVSFAGINRIKEFNSDAESVVICDTPAYEEEFACSSDSSAVLPSSQSHLLEGVVSWTGGGTETPGRDMIPIYSVANRNSGGAVSEQGDVSLSDADMDLTRILSPDRSERPLSMAFDSSVYPSARRGLRNFTLYEDDMNMCSGYLNKENVEHRPSKRSTSDLLLCSSLMSEYCSESVPEESRGARKSWAPDNSNRYPMRSPAQKRHRLSYLPPADCEMDFTLLQDSERPTVYNSTREFKTPTSSLRADFISPSFNSFQCSSTAIVQRIECYSENYVEVPSQTPVSISRAPSTLRTPADPSSLRNVSLEPHSQSGAWSSRPTPVATEYPVESSESVNRSKNCFNGTPRHLIYTETESPACEVKVSESNKICGSVNPRNKGGIKSTMLLNCSLMDEMTVDNCRPLVDRSDGKRKLEEMKGDEVDASTRIRHVFYSTDPEGGTTRTKTMMDQVKDSSKRYSDILTPKGFHRTASLRSELSGASLESSASRFKESRTSLQSDCQSQTRQRHLNSPDTDLCIARNRDYLTEQKKLSLYGQHFSGDVLSETMSENNSVSSGVEAQSSDKSVEPVRSEVVPSCDLQDSTSNSTDLMEETELHSDIRHIDTPLSVPPCRNSTDLMEETELHSDIHHIDTPLSVPPCRNDIITEIPSKLLKINSDLLDMLVSPDCNTKNNGSDGASSPPDDNSLQVTCCKSFDISIDKSLVPEPVVDVPPPPLICSQTPFVVNSSAQLPNSDQFLSDNDCADRSAEIMSKTPMEQTCVENSFEVSSKPSVEQIFVNESVERISKIPLQPVFELTPQSLSIGPACVEQTCENVSNITSENLPVLNTDDNLLIRSNVKTQPIAHTDESLPICPIDAQTDDIPPVLRNSKEKHTMPILDEAPLDPLIDENKPLHNTSDNLALIEKNVPIHPAFEDLPVIPTSDNVQSIRPTDQNAIHSTIDVEPDVEASDKDQLNHPNDEIAPINPTFQEEPIYLTDENIPILPTFKDQPVPQTTDEDEPSCMTDKNTPIRPTFEDEPVQTLDAVELIHLADEIAPILQSFEDQPVVQTSDEDDHICANDENAHIRPTLEERPVQTMDKDQPIYPTYENVSVHPSSENRTEEVVTCASPVVIHCSYSGKVENNIEVMETEQSHASGDRRLNDVDILSEGCRVCGSKKLTRVQSECRQVQTEFVETGWTDLAAATEMEPPSGLETSTSLSDVRLPGQVASPLQRYNKEFMEELGFRFWEWTEWRRTLFKNSITLTVRLPWTQFSLQTPILEATLHSMQKSKISERGLKYVSGLIVSRLESRLSQVNVLGDCEELMSTVAELGDTLTPFYLELDHLLRFKASDIVNNRLSISVANLERRTAFDVVMNLDKWFTLGKSDVTVNVHLGKVGVAEVWNIFQWLPVSRKRLFDFACALHRI